MKIAIDCGHGYNTAGKCSPPFVNDITHTYKGNTITIKKGESLKEHVANVGVAIYLEKELKRCCFEIYRSGYNDDNPKDDVCPANPNTDITERQQAIRKENVDASISIHFNAYGSAKTFNSASGINVYVGQKESRLKKSLPLAQKVLKNLVDCYGQNNRGIVKNDTLGMTNATGLNTSVAILLELGFMTNQKEAEKYFCNPEAWYNYAVAIAKALCEHFGMAYIKEEKRHLKLTSPYMRGDDVKELQSLIDVTTDGVYGPATDKKVKEILDALGM